MKKGKRRILVLSGILAALTVYAGINLDIYMHTMGLAKQPVMKPQFETVWQSEDEGNEIPFNEAAQVVAEGEYGVGAGHLLVKNSLAAELHELVYLFNQPALSSDAGQLHAFLNQGGGAYAVDVDAAGRATFDVISTGSWSAYFQRIILHRLSNEYRFLPEAPPQGRRHEWRSVEAHLRASPGFQPESPQDTCRMAPLSWQPAG